MARHRRCHKQTRTLLALVVLHPRSSCWNSAAGRAATASRLCGKSSRRCARCAATRAFASTRSMRTKALIRSRFWTRLGRTGRTTSAAASFRDSRSTEPLIFSARRRSIFCFSQASLHWVPDPPVPLRRAALASPETRARARRTMQTVLELLVDHRASAGLVLAVLCLGTIGGAGDNDDEIAPIFSWMERLYGDAFGAAFPNADDRHAMMVVPQVSHRLGDIQDAVARLHISTSWIYGGPIGSPAMPEMTPPMAERVAAGMLSVFWPEHLETSVWPGAENETRRQEAWNKATQAMKESLLEIGFEERPSQIAFVCRFE